METIGTGHQDDQSQRAELLALCHDIRQSVAAGLLLSAPPTGGAEISLDDRARELIHAQFRAIDELVASELDESGSRPTTIDLGAVLAECAAVVGIRYGVVVDQKSQGNMMMFGDPVLVRRVFANILDNAARAAGAGGTVTIRGRRRSNEVRVEVRDTGLGFGHIPAGLGRGLSIVESALRAQRGHLEIVSDDMGGTLVKVRLPIETAGMAS